MAFDDHFKIRLLFIAEKDQKAIDHPPKRESRKRNPKKFVPKQCDRRKREPFVIEPVQPIQ